MEKKINTDTDFNTSVEFQETSYIWFVLYRCDTMSLACTVTMRLHL